jgi:chemotaxis protein MotB
MKKKHVEQENSERWLLTYADLITLLLALFVVLWSFEKMDAKQVMEALSGVFGDESGGESVLEGTGTTIDQSLARSIRDQQQIESVKKALDSAGLSDIIEISTQLGKLNITMKGDVSFQSGNRALKSEVKKALVATLPIIKDQIERFKRLKISIEGHTDNDPIATAEFPSNLHLSTARALSTAEYLISDLRIDPKLIQVEGYGEYKPIAPNNTLDGKKKNRRVQISLITGEQSSSAAKEED